MTVLLIGVVVFLIMLFVFVVPAINNGNTNSRNRNQRYGNQHYGNQRYGNQHYGNQHYGNYSPNYTQPPQQQQGFPLPQSNRAGGCQQFVILGLLVLLIFVGAVVYWSISVQAGGGLY